MTFAQMFRRSRQPDLAATRSAPRVPPASYPDAVTGVEAARLAGVTYRQLDYWDRTGLVSPTVPADGSGSSRWYTPADVERLCAVRALLAIGLSVQAIRQVHMDRRPSLAEALRGVMS